MDPLRDSATSATHQRISQALAATSLVVICAGLPLDVVARDTFKACVAAVALTSTLLVFLVMLARRGEALGWSAWLGLPLALSAVAVVSSMWAAPALTLPEAARWVLVFIAMGLAANAFRAGFMLWARAISLGLMFTSLIALGQFWFDLDWFAAVAPPGSNFGNRNLYAEFAMTALPFLVAVAFASPSRGGLALRAAAVGIVVVSVMSTGTRSALLALVLLTAAGSVLLAAGHSLRRSWMPGWPRVLVFSGVVVSTTLLLGVIPTGNPEIRADHELGGLRGLTAIERSFRAAGTLAVPFDPTAARASSNASRLVAWKAGWTMALDNPLRGVGAGAWNAVLPRYLPLQYDTEFMWHGHNESLQLVAEFGLAGWLALLGLAWIAARGSVRAWRREEQEAGPAEFPVAAACGLSMVAFGVVSFFGLSLHQAPALLVFAIAAGCLVALAGMRWVPLATLAAPLRLALYGAAGVLALAAIVFAVRGFAADMEMRKGLKKLAEVERRMKADDAASRAPEIARMRLEAADRVERAIRLWPDHGVDLIEAIYAFESFGDANTVLRLARHALPTRPYAADAKCHLARAFAETKQLDEAEAMLAALARTKPLSSCAKVSRFALLLARGNLREGAAFAETVLRELPPGIESEPRVVRFVTDVGYQAAVATGDPQLAMRLLEHRLQRLPAFAAGTRLLMGNLRAGPDPAQFRPEALAEFQKAFDVATAQQKASVLAEVPPAYRARISR